MADIDTSRSDAAERVTAYLKRRTEHRHHDHIDGYNGNTPLLVSDLHTLLDRLESAEVDAKRYRWLRDSPDSGAAIRAVYEDVLKLPNAVDDFIDAALSASEGAKP